MSFIDVRLPKNIGTQYVGGPVFLTIITQSLTGVETRDKKRSIARHEFDLGYPLSQTQFAELAAFFYAVGGAGDSFRHRDPIDFKLGDDATDTRQSVGTGDAVKTVFQIFKQYTSGAATYNRTLTKIVANTLRVWVNTVEVTTGFTINLLTGEITFTTIPGVAEDVAALCEFDVPVRFLSDKLSIRMPQQKWAGITSLPLIEVVGE